MTAIVAFVIRRPMLLGLIGALSIADAARDINIGHDDWWLPALVAFVAALLMRKWP